MDRAFYLGRIDEVPPDADVVTATLWEWPSGRELNAWRWASTSTSRARCRGRVNGCESGPGWSIPGRGRRSRESKLRPTTLRLMGDRPTHDD
jgi:hypothetical protein